MSSLCSSSSTSGSFLSSIASRSKSSIFCRSGVPLSSHYSRRAVSYLRAQSPRYPKAVSLEELFINSLTHAGCCNRHKPKQIRGSFRPAIYTTRRPFHSLFFDASKNGAITITEGLSETSLTRDELLALVDQYDGEAYIEPTPLPEIPSRYAEADGPNITVSDKKDDEWPPPGCAWGGDDRTKITISKLTKALKDYSKDSEEVYQLYRELPEPRAPYLEAKVRHKMLRRLSVVEYKTEHSMLRYLSVIDDMKVAAIPLTTAEWTSAISFAARYVGRSTEVEVEAALHMWREMEHVAGVKGNDATFNVLFDVACKAGKFTLAEMIYREMGARGLKFNRYHHVSLIHFYGLKEDGGGARAAYKELVRAGEIVDTVVLNAVISALVKSSEASAAENIYERMKNLQLSGSLEPPKDYMAKREMNLALMRMATAARLAPSELEGFQKQSSVAPDVHTYRILVNHFAHTGQLDKVTRLLDEMRLFGLPLHGSFFLALFKGFFAHGGARYTEWTSERLDSVWQAFMEALDGDSKVGGGDDSVDGGAAKSDGNVQTDHTPLFLSRVMATWALRAFAKCAGRQHALAGWEEMQRVWTPDEPDREALIHVLNEIWEAGADRHLDDDWLTRP